MVMVGVVVVGGVVVVVVVVGAVVVVVVVVAIHPTPRFLHASHHYYDSY
jgi:hypothetical protein